MDWLPTLVILVILLTIGVAALVVWAIGKNRDFSPLFKRSFQVGTAATAFVIILIVLYLTTIHAIYTNERTF